jgi:hypothetical protein
LRDLYLGFISLITTHMSVILEHIDLAVRKNALEYRSPYGYTPSSSAGIAYVVCFAILTLIITGLAFRYKYWIAFVTLVPGGLREF